MEDFVMGLLYIFAIIVVVFLLYIMVHENISEFLSGKKKREELEKDLEKQYGLTTEREREYENLIESLNQKNAMLEDELEQATALIYQDVQHLKEKLDVVTDERNRLEYKLSALTDTPEDITFDEELYLENQYLVKKNANLMNENEFQKDLITVYKKKADELSKKLCEIPIYWDNKTLKLYKKGIKDGRLQKAIEEQTYKRFASSIQLTVADTLEFSVEIMPNTNKEYHKIEKEKRSGFYTTTLTTCDCHYFQNPTTGTSACKHILALALYLNVITPDGKFNKSIALPKNRNNI